MQYISLDRFFAYPGKVTSAAAVYIHDGASIQAHLEVATKSDAEKIADKLEQLSFSLRDGIDRGTFK